MDDFHKLIWRHYESIIYDGLLKRAQYYVFEMLSGAFLQCNNYLSSRMDADFVEVPEVIDFSNRLPEPKFELNDVAVRRMVKTSFVDGVAAINDVISPVTYNAVVERNKLLIKKHSITVVKVKIK